MRCHAHRAPIVCDRHCVSQFRLGHAGEFQLRRFDQSLEDQHARVRPNARRTYGFGSFSRHQLQKFRFTCKCVSRCNDQLVVDKNRQVYKDVEGPYGRGALCCFRSLGCKRIGQLQPRRHYQTLEHKVGQMYVCLRPRSVDRASPRVLPFCLFPNRCCASLSRANFECSEAASAVAGVFSF